MRRLTVDPDNPQPAVVEEAVGVLRAGGVIAYPTETLYGLGADARNPDAVSRVFRIKGRAEGRALPVIIGEVGMLGEVAAHVPPAALELAKAFWPGPLTLVLPAADLPSALLGGGDTVAVRVSGSLLCRKLSLQFGGPITATSANLSEGPELRDAEQVVQVLGERVDLILDAGPAPLDRPSTIVDCTGPRLRILREGAISRTELTSRLPELDWA
ncbi:MAG: L-threonylcarbamoyladenylate synthase [candidate division KSB1 bacterium]|nr:L-threonylcarbamoyladenylate synthase [candidate division KSB1 bacterium]